MSHAYHPQCGCATCCREEEADEARAEMIDDLHSRFVADDDKRREAEEWTAGTFDESHYTDLTLALHELHHSDLLMRLYRLAKDEAAALDAQLRSMAEAEYDKGEEA